MKKNIDQIEQTNTQVVALSVDTPERSAGFRQEANLPFELLCDTDKNVVKLYHLLNPFEHTGIAYPAIYIINSEGRICYRSLDDMASRVNITEVLSFLERLQANPALEEVDGTQKSFIFPSVAVMWQIMLNMTFRGTGADWKHYFMFTFVYTPRNLYKLITKPFRKT